MKKKLHLCQKAKTEHTPSREWGMENGEQRTEWVESACK